MTKLHLSCTVRTCMQQVVRLAKRAQTGWGGLSDKAPSLEDCYEAMADLPDRAKTPKEACTLKHIYTF